MTGADAPDHDGASSGCVAANLFAIVWEQLDDLMGSAAAATLLRRAVKQAVARSPELRLLQIRRDRFEYSYVVPSAWQKPCPDGVASLRGLMGELHPLLIELTGTVVVQRLHGIPELARCRVLPLEVRREG